MLLNKNMREKEEKTKKFMECESLEEFKANYIMFHKQERALNDGLSYFNVKESNVDGTFIGEQFDNPLRIKALLENNKEFLQQVNIEELNEEVKTRYEKDVEKMNEAKKNKD